MFEAGVAILIAMFLAVVMGGAICSFQDKFYKR